MKYLLVILLLILALGCATNDQPLSVNYLDPDIAYSGRIDTTSAQFAQLFWSGTSVRLNFEGQSISATLKDESGDNYYNVIVDDSLYILRADSTKKTYQLASGLTKGPHSIELFKRTEYNRGKTDFYGFYIQGNAKVLPRETSKKRKIEFFGNSITCGYGVEDLSGKDSPDSTYTNFYRSYAYLTAKHFDADYHCTCKSGIGISISWFPTIMPEIYDRLNPQDSTSQWDFSRYMPDVVVINLAQNDSWLVNRPEHEEFKARFGTEKPSEEFIINAYKDFLQTIRGKYPNAKIICALGNMDATQDGSLWPGYITKAVESINDQNILTNFFPFKNSPGHPSISEQEDMAKSLIAFIDENVEW